MIPLKFIRVHRYPRININVVLLMPTGLLFESEQIPAILSLIDSILGENLSYDYLVLQQTQILFRRLTRLRKMISVKIFVTVGV